MDRPASNRFRARVGNEDVYTELSINSDIYTALRKIFMWARNDYSDLKDELIIERWNSWSHEWIEEERIPITDLEVP